jgi:myo-inositol-1(or 4)-monophosphatase
MSDIEELLFLAKDVAYEAAKKIQLVTNNNSKKFLYSEELKKEMKAVVDIESNNYIISRLRHTGIRIISEESGVTSGPNDPSLVFIIDPLDGTVNFIRDCGSSAVSIALWQDKTPIFGVLCLIPSLQIAWGGKKFGSFLGDKQLSVSNIFNKDHSILCTGIPSRLNLELLKNKTKQMELMSAYGKIRMLGAASLSLLQIAKGSAEAYIEFEIMIWDVAAGLAIVEGAGGGFIVEDISYESPINVFVKNIANTDKYSLQSEWDSNYE